MDAQLSRFVASLNRRPFRLFVVLYAVLAAIAFLASASFMPEAIREAIHDLTGGRGLSAAAAARFGLESPLSSVPVKDLWAVGTVAMGGAGLLALPMAWLYTITRQKRGYRQSVVQSLILLPVVVAGVVVLVKFSLALAFGLAGIVAAVRFRTTIEDSKDAVYFFVATGIGLASGVELSVAATISVVFNFVTLALFSSDFGRTPARLEGERAEERMRRALALANRTSQFVARLDREVLEEMAPEQLEALADRAWKRRAETGDVVAEEEEKEFDTTLTVLTDGGTRAREAIESVLHLDAKRWRFHHGSAAAEGGQVLEYQLKLKKHTQPTAFLDALRALTGLGVRQPELK